MTKQDLKDLAITDKDVEMFMEDYKTMQASADAEKLWILDFYPGHKEYIEKVAQLPENQPPNEKPTRVLYAGRCLLFTR